MTDNDEKKPSLDKVIDDLSKLKNIPDAMENLGEFFKPLEEKEKEEDGTIE